MALSRTITRPPGQGPNGLIRLGARSPARAETGFNVAMAPRTRPAAVEDSLTAEELERIDAYWPAEDHPSGGHDSLPANPPLNPPPQRHSQKPPPPRHLGTAPAATPLFTPADRPL